MYIRHLAWAMEFSNYSVVALITCNNNNKSCLSLIPPYFNSEMTFCPYLVCCSYW